MVDVLAGQQPAAPADDDDAATLRRPALSAARADEVVPITRRDQQPWFLEEPELPTEKLPAAPAEPQLRLAPTPVVAPPSIRPLVRTIAPPRASLVPALVGAGVAGAGALLGISILAGAVLARPASTLAKSSVHPQLPSFRAPEPSAAAPVGCSVRAPARRVAERVLPGGPVTIAGLGTELLAGAVVNRRTGIGLTLSKADLSPRRTTWIGDPAHVAAVVPVSDGSFVADRWTHSVPGTAAFSVGMTPRGFSRVAAGGLEQEAIWAGGARDAITRPSIARAPAPRSGWAIAYRQGASSIRLGWIDEHGRSRGPLASFAQEAEQASAPSIAAAGERLTLTFAERVSGTWRIRIGDGAIAKHPEAMRTFVLPSGGPGHPARDPAIAALDHGWLLVWAEGPSRERVVRAQMLDRDLSPVGAALAIGSAPAASQSFAAWSEGDQVVVLFTRDAGGGRGELFGAGLGCH